MIAHCWARYWRYRRPPSRPPIPALRELLSHGGQIDDKHMCWVVTGTTLKIKQLGSNWGERGVFYIGWWGSPLMKRNLSKTWKKMLREWAGDVVEGDTNQEEEAAKEKTVKQKCAWQAQETARKWAWLEPREWGEKALRWGAGGSLDPGFTRTQAGAAGQSWAEQGCEGLTCERVSLATIWASDKGGSVRRFLQ